MNQSFRNNKKERETGLEPSLYLKNILFIGGFRTALLYSTPYSTLNKDSTFDEACQGCLWHNACP